MNKLFFQFICCSILLSAQMLQAQTQKAKSKGATHYSNRTGITRFNENNLSDVIWPQSKSNFFNKHILSNRGSVKQRLDSSIYGYTDAGTMQLLISNKSHFSYNPEGKFISELTFSYDDVSKSWNYSNRYTYSYNTAGDLVLSITERWNAGWTNLRKFEYFYDAKAYLASIILYKWNSTSGLWVNNYKIEFTNNAKGLEIEDIFYTWNSGTQNWDKDSRYVSSYDAFDKLKSETLFIWDDLSQSWKINSKTEITYNAKHQLIISLSSNWDESANNWTNSQKEENQYDTSGNLLSTYHSNWNTTFQTWMFSLDIENSFDLNYSRQELITPFDEYPNKLINSKSLRYENSSWSLFDTSAYYYSDIITGSSNFSGTSIDLYPNPTKEYFTVDFNSIDNQASFELIDLFGRIVLSRQLTGKDIISVAGLSKGFYLYSLQIGDNRYSGKLLIE